MEWNGIKSNFLYSGWLLSGYNCSNCAYLESVASSRQWLGTATLISRLEDIPLAKLFYLASSLTITSGLDIDRGPYNNGPNYLNALLEIMQHDAAKYLGSDDEYDVELGQDMKEVFEGLRDIIPQYFPHGSHREHTMLFHRDISLMNILVDSKGHLASIVDWECVAAVPAWQARDLPQLQGRPYALTEVPLPLHDNADAYSIKYYKENLENYELSQLRAFFLEEM